MQGETLSISCKILEGTDDDDIFVTGGSPTSVRAE